MVPGDNLREAELDGSRGASCARRRRFLALCGSLVVGGCAAPGGVPDSTAGSGTDGTRTGASASASDEDWRLKRGDAANTGCNPAAMGLGETVETTWRSGVGNVTAPPVVVGDVLFTGGGRTVYAIDLSTGEKRWTTETGVITGNFSPAAAGDTVYVAGRDDGGGRLFAMATPGGSVEWQYDVGVTTSPMAVDGRVFVGGADGDRGVLHAFDAATGERAWTFSVGGDGRSRVDDVPAVVDGTVYCTAGRRLDAREENREGRLFALDAATGARRWTATAAAPVVSAPVVGEGTTYFGDTGGTVHAVDAEAGDEKWTRRLESGVLTSPAVADDTIYVKDAYGVCSALDAASGRPAWHATTDSSGIDLSVGGDTVYVGGNSLYALDGADGSRRWSHDVNAYSDSHYAPAITTEYVLHGICIKENAGEEYDNYVYSLA